MIINLTGFDHEIGIVIALVLIYGIEFCIGLLKGKQVGRVNVRE